MNEYDLEVLYRLTQTVEHGAVSARDCVDAFKRYLIEEHDMDFDTSADELSFT